MQLTLKDLILVSYQSLWANKSRTIITILIIALGIMALVGINTAINSMNGAISSNFSAMGVGAFQIDAETKVKMGKGREFSQLTKPINEKQYYLFHKLFMLPASVSAYYWAKNGAKATCGDKETNPDINILAVDENYLDAKNMNLQIGRNFSNFDVRSGRNVCLVGFGVAKKLFNYASEAIDTTILLASVPYKVIGILQEKGSSMRNNVDNSVLVTINNAKRNFYSGEINYNILVKVKDQHSLNLAKDEAIGKMRQARQLRPAEENNFEISTNEDLLKNMNESLQYVSLAAIFIAVITLLGAAVGLMNIMLVSVVERTKEVGLQKALGATSNDIKYQFLTESILISMIGGTFGIVLGLLVGNIIGAMMNSGFVIPWNWIALGFLTCLLVGIMSGIYPAIKASRLNPIQALRYE